MAEELLQDKGNEGVQIPEHLKKLGLSEEEIENLAREILEGETKKEDELINLEEPEIPKKEKKKFADIFDSVEELEKAYKNLQAEYTKDRQKFKPFEQFIELLQNNPEFAKFVLEKSQEFFLGGKKKEKAEEEDIWSLDEDKVSKETFDKNEILNIIRSEVNQALTAQRLIDEFRKNHPDITDEELVQVITHAKNFGGDLETSYMILFKDKFKEELKRQVLNELKGHLAKKQTSPQTELQPSSEGAVAGEVGEEDLWRLAVEVAKNPAKLKELDPRLRATLLNILARQIL